MLNRIMLISAVVVCFISAAATLLGNCFTVIAAALCVIGFVVCLILRRYHAARSFAVVFPVALIFCLPLFFAVSNMNSTKELSGQTAYITGYVSEEPEYYKNYTVYTVKTDNVDIVGAKQNIKLRLSSYTTTDMDVFQNFSAKVTFRENSGEYALSNYADGLYVSAFTEEIIPAGTTHSSIYSYAVSIRRSIRSAIYSFLPFEEASVVSGILLGDKDNIPDELYGLFKSCGIIHIVCVSGLHLSVICYSLLGLLKKLKVSNKVANIITALSVVVIMAVTGFSPSIMRAAFMFLLVLLGKSLYQDIDTLNLLGCSVVINLLINPFAVFNVGLQLSVLSTAGIVIVVPWAKRRLRRKFDKPNIFNRIISYIAISTVQCVAATLFTLPVLCASIGYVSVVAPLASVLLIYPATIILMLGVPAAILGLTPLGFLAYPLFLAAGLITKYFNWVVRLFNSIPITTVRFGSSETLFCLVLCFILGAVAISLYPNRRTVRITSLGIALIICINILLNTVLTANRISVSVLSLKSGYASVVVHKEREGTVAVCGDMTTAECHNFIELITRNTNSLDILILPDTERDLRKELSIILSSVKVKCLLIEDPDLLASCSALGADITVTSLDAASLDLWGTVSVTQHSDEYGTAFSFTSDHASCCVTYPKSSGFLLPELFAAADITFIAAPYPAHLPEYIHHTDSVLLSGGNITKEIYDFYGQSQKVTVMNNGDVINFTLNKQPQLSK